MQPSRGTLVTPRLIFGLFIAVAGMLLIADRFELIDAGLYWQLWPLFLIGMGLAKLFQPHHGRAGALVLIFLGGFFMLRNLDLIYMDLGDLVPFALVLLGLTLVVTSLARRGRPRGPAVDSSAEVHSFAMLGGSHVVSSSPEFLGGTATAILGACEIDLRQAAIAGSIRSAGGAGVDGGGEAVLDTFAFWGGVDVVVPDGWSVVMRGTPLLGTFEDKTLQPAGGSAQRLVVKGLAIMGAVEVKNPRELG